MVDINDPQKEDKHSAFDDICSHEWLIPSDKRTRCKRCGDDGWVSHDGKVHESYEACMKHDVLSYGASPLSLPQKVESESNNEKVFKVSEAGYYRIGEQTVYLDADGTLKIKEPTQKVYAKTQSGHSRETTPKILPFEDWVGEIKSIIGQAMGYASMCWEPRPEGVFDSGLCAAHLDLTVERVLAQLDLSLTAENVSEKPQTEAPETAMEFLSRLGMDAKKWTDEFLKLKPDATDFGVMIGWFSNAIMAGYDRANWANEKRIAELEAENDKLRQASEWHLGLYRQFEKTNEELTAENERLQEQFDKSNSLETRLTQDFRNASGALVQALEEIAEMHTRNADLEAKLKLATDGLETLQTEADDWHLRGIARETLAKLRGEK